MTLIGLLLQIKLRIHPGIFTVINLMDKWCSDAHLCAKSNYLYLAGMQIQLLLIIKSIQHPTKSNYLYFTGMQLSGLYPNKIPNSTPPIQIT